MDREKQEKEVMEYLKQQFQEEFFGDWNPVICFTAKAIMRRYELREKGT